MQVNIRWLEDEATAFKRLDNEYWHSPRLSLNGIDAASTGYPTAGVTVPDGR